MQSIQERIRAVRKYNGLSQVAFAEKLGAKPNQLISVENDKQQVPGSLLQKIVEIFQVDGTWLLTGEGSMQRSPAAEQPSGDADLFLLFMKAAFARLDGRYRELAKPLMDELDKQQQDKH